MRLTNALLPALLLGTSLAHSAQTSVDVEWLDNYNGMKPITDNSDVALANFDVLQIGYFAGVDPDKDPSTYTPADWASFTALTGVGSLNPVAFPDSYVGSGLNPGDPLGFFSTGVTLFTDRDSGIPTIPVRIGIRIFDASTVAAANNYNTVSASGAGWILPAASDSVPPPTPADASMDDADILGTLAWEGTPFKTDLVPGVAVPDLVLTGVTLVNPTTLQISWSGGDGSNDIQTSTTGQGFSTVSSGQTSPATITINPGATPTLLVRVIEP